jgi:hypothetical protein
LALSDAGQKQKSRSFLRLLAICPEGTVGYAGTRAFTFSVA